jgi:hypothetical protein
VTSAARSEVAVDLGALGGIRTPSLLTLLCLSRAHEGFHRPVELPAALADDVSLEAAADLEPGLALGGAPGDVGAGAGQLRIRVSAMAQLARLRARSPPRNCPVTDCTVQGMACARSGQAPVWPLITDRRRHRGSAVKGGRWPFPEEREAPLTVEGCRGTLSGPSPVPSAARAPASALHAVVTGKPRCGVSFSAAA